MTIAIEELQRLPETEDQLTRCFATIVTLIPLTGTWISLGISTCHSCTNTDG